ncbi:conjugal transfer protein TrbA [Serratia sp. SRS-8-S-2018]|uniref:secretion/conjugation apparatus DotM-related subunit n=1 Tax=Serratia sp. SRS-8-S-2018 TaxID=2591107 RepID=UPI0015E8745B|nr:conjugal transfer protein TrbA [Serratia sp. SRS-8-S-2018]
MNTKSHLQPRAGNEQGLMLLLVAALAAFLLWIYQPPVMYGCCWLLYQLWSLCDFPRVHNQVAEKLNLLAWAGSQVNQLSWGQFIDVMNHTAGILLAPMVLIVMGGLLMVRNHPRNQTRRHIDVYTLPHIMARFSPSIIPALCYGDKKTQLLNVDPPEHRSAQWPEEFAVEHKLIIGDRLDTHRTQTAFECQLGTPLESFSSFSAHERALVAIFGLVAFLNDRKAAEALLDSLNRSCLIKSRRDKGQMGYPVLQLASKAFEKVTQTPAAQDWLKHHSTTRTALYALHNLDMRLPCARFRWLKGLDRPLWYTLASTGRPKAFIEGAGVIAVANWETVVAQMEERLHTSIPVPENRMDKAIKGLEDELRSVGLIIDNRTTNTSVLSEPVFDEDEDEDAPIVILQPLMDTTEKTTSETAPLQTKATIPGANTSPKKPGRAHFIPRAR